MTVLQFLRNQGYANAKVEIKVLESQKKNRIRIAIEADRGQEYVFGMLLLQETKILKTKIFKNLYKSIKASPTHLKKFKTQSNKSIHFMAVKVT